MTLSDSPAAVLDPAIARILRADAIRAEQEGNLTETQWALIQHHGWLNMYVPKEYGGLELTLPQILRIEEALSWCDGSVGWVVTLCSGAAWFVGFLGHDVSKQVFSVPEVCFAGSGAVTGIATATDQGFEISGKWPYATGSLRATVFTMNCAVLKNGKTLYEADGSAQIKSFLLAREQVTIQQSWNGMGMNGTSTHAMEVSHQVVAANRAFTIHPDCATLPHLIFKFPFLQLAELTLAVNLSGMAFRFIQLTEEICRRKNGDEYLDRVKQAEGALNEIRSRFFKSADSAWNSLETDNQISENTLVNVSAICREIVEQSRTLVNALYPLCGLEAADRKNEINRVWRNFHTAGQHSLFRR